ASAFFALPVIILLKTSSAIFYNVLNIIFGLQRRKWKKGLYNLLLEGLNEDNFSQLGYGGRLMDEQEKKLQLPPYRCFCCVGASPLCLKFKIYQVQDAKKIEKLNNIFFTLRARSPEIGYALVEIMEGSNMKPSDMNFRGKNQFVDDTLGKCCVKINDFKDGERHEMWLPLDNIKTRRLHLAIKVIEGVDKLFDPPCDVDASMTEFKNENGSVKAPVKNKDPRERAYGYTTRGTPPNTFSFKMQRAKMKSNGVSYVLLISAYGKDRREEEALAVFAHQLLCKKDKPAFRDG
ncbi:C2 domain-containing protein-like protein, partial [Tanacetum coccineum]